MDELVDYNYKDGMYSHTISGDLIIALVGMKVCLKMHRGSRIEFFKLNI